MLQTVAKQALRIWMEFRQVQVHLLLLAESVWLLRAIEIPIGISYYMPMEIP